MHAPLQDVEFSTPGWPAEHAQVTDCVCVCMCPDDGIAGLLSGQPKSVPVAVQAACGGALGWFPRGGKAPTGLESDYGFSELGGL